MPSKKKMAKMPAEAPKAAPMGPLFGIVLEWWIVPGDFGMLKGIAGFCLHPEESAGGVLAELELGNLVAGGRFGSVVCFAPGIGTGPIDGVSRSAYLGPYWLLNDLYGWRARHCCTPWWPEDLRPYMSCSIVSAPDVPWSDLKGEDGRVPAGGVWAAWCRCCVRRCCCLRRG